MSVTGKPGGKQRHYHKPTALAEPNISTATTAVPDPASTPVDVPASPITVPAVAVPDPASTPVDVPASPITVPAENPTTADPPTENQSEPSEKKCRVPIGKTMDINIAPARVKRHLDKRGVNACADTLKSQLRESIAPYTAAVKALEAHKSDPLSPELLLQYKKTVEDGQKLYDQVQLQLDAISKVRIRFSGDVFTILAIVCDEIVRQLVFCMTVSARDSGKLVGVKNLYTTPGITNLPVHKFIKNLPTYIKTSKIIQLQIAHEESEKILNSNIKSQIETRDRLIKKLMKLTNKCDGPPTNSMSTTLESFTQLLKDSGIETPVSSKPVAAPESEPDLQKSDFSHYISETFNYVRKDPVYGNIRYATPLRDHLSDLLIEFIAHIASLVRLIVQSMGNKTVNHHVMMTAIEQLLVDGVARNDTISLVPSTQPSPDILALEREKKKLNPEYTIPDLATLPQTRIYLAILTPSPSSDYFPKLKCIIEHKLSMHTN